MREFITAFCLVLILFIVAVVKVHADPYVAFKGGAGFLKNSDEGNITTSHDTGWLASGAVGWDFGEIRESDIGGRVEVEGLHTENTIDRVFTTEVIEVEIPCPKENKRKEVCSKPGAKETTIGGGGTNTEDFIFFNGYLDIPFTRKLTGYIGGGYSINNAIQFIAGGIWQFSSAWGVTTEFRLIDDLDDDYTNPVVLIGARYTF